MYVHVQLTMRFYKMQKIQLENNFVSLNKYEVNVTVCVSDNSPGLRWMDRVYYTLTCIRPGPVTRL